MKLSFLIFCCLLLTTIGFTQEQLIVFFQAKKDIVFVENTLPKLRAYAKEKQIILLEKDLREGVPSEISSTPALVYQNFRGRSIYAARYTRFSSIRNFIRTSRGVSSRLINICKEHTLTLQTGRLQVLAPLKVTPLQGALPSGFSATEFITQAKESIGEGMKSFRWEKEICLNKTDRIFYLDLHPYRNAEGQLFLNIEMYSQFSCIEPVFTLEQPLTGDYKRFETVFYQAGQVLAEQIRQQLKYSKIGDALSPIPTFVAVVPWGKLGLSLPLMATKEYPAEIAAINFQRKWQYIGPIDEDIPALQFHFMEPLERYAGEVRKITGNTRVDRTGMIQGGAFIVQTKSLTMGMPDLDEKVLEQYIKAAKFPQSSFVFQKIEQNKVLKLGETTALTITGEFQLMHYRVPLTLRAQITPILGEKGEPLLQIQTAFNLNITENFKITGPDGPDPARQILKFNLNFLMQ